MGGIRLGVGYPRRRDVGLVLGLGYPRGRYVCLGQIGVSEGEGCGIRIW